MSYSTLTPTEINVNCSSKNFDRSRNSPKTSTLQGTVPS